jgi:hypothetical protein
MEVSFVINGVLFILIAIALINGWTIKAWTSGCKSKTASAVIITSILIIFILSYVTGKFIF